MSVVELLTSFARGFRRGFRTRREQQLVASLADSYSDGVRVAAAALRAYSRTNNPNPNGDQPA